MSVEYNAVRRRHEMMITDGFLKGDGCFPTASATAESSMFLGA